MPGANIMSTLGISYHCLVVFSTLGPLSCSFTYDPQSSFEQVTPLMQTCDPQSTNTHLIDLVFLPSLLHFIKADIFFSFLSCSTSIIHMRCLIMYLAHLITHLVVRLISIWRTMNINKDIEYQSCGALGTRAPLTTTMDMLISSTLLEGHQTCYY